MTRFRKLSRGGGRERARSHDTELSFIPQLPSGIPRSPSIDTGLYLIKLPSSPPPPPSSPPPPPSSPPPPPSSKSRSLSLSGPTEDDTIGPPPPINWMYYKSDPHRIFQSSIFPFVLILLVLIIIGIIVGISVSQRGRLY